MQTAPKNKRTRFAATSAEARITFSAAPAAPTSADKPAADPSLTIGTLRAYPLVWNKLSSSRGTYFVRLVKGSAVFTTPTLALYNHHFGRLLGNTAAGTMRINPPDDYGQSVEIDLPDTSDGRDVMTLVQRGDIRGMSFSMSQGFEESFATEENGQQIVNATRYTVDEVSVLVDPAFIDTTVEMLDDDDKDTEEPDAETLPVDTEAEFSQHEKERNQTIAKWNEYRLYRYRL